MRVFDRVATFSMEEVFKPLHSNALGSCILGLNFEHFHYRTSRRTGTFSSPDAQLFAPVPALNGSAHLEKTAPT